MREGLNGRTGLHLEHEQQIDEEAAAHCAKIEQAPTTPPLVSGPSDMPTLQK